jgi:DNA polymerase-3 subunit epsilon
MCGFDLETTGVDPETDRIVSSCIVDVEPGKTPEVDNLLVNPGIPIPAGATEVHGITDLDATRGLPPATAIQHLVSELSGAVRAGIPIVGMNLSYDLTMLDREARRHQVMALADEYPAGIWPVIDVYVIDKWLDPYRKDSRKLYDLCQHYGVAHDGAHNAIYDTVAACRIAWKIGRLTSGTRQQILAWYKARSGMYTNPGYHGFDDQANRLRELGRMGLLRLHQQQQIWRFEQCLSLQTHLRKTDPTVVCNPGWPMIPLPESATTPPSADPNVAAPK